MDTHGQVKAVPVLRGAPLFDEPAVAAVQQWRYQPLLLNGVPTEFILTVTVVFNLPRRSCLMTSAYTIREVLVPTDLSARLRPGPRARPAALPAGSARGSPCTTRSRSPTHLRPLGLRPRSPGLVPRLEGGRERAALARVADSASRPEVVVERTSSVHRALVQRIKTTQPDLTVMATHGREGVSHLLLGSVTEKVVQQVHRPVLCIRATEHGGRSPTAASWSRPTCPSRPGSPSRWPAISPEAFDAEIIGLHVVPERQPRHPHRRPRDPPRGARRRRTSGSSSRRTSRGSPLTAQVHTGPVWERIVHVARVEKADLIVMSTRGHDSLADRILGSNTERVVRHAPCPVLVA